jgi:hypothetical protein
MSTDATGYHEHPPVIIDDLNSARIVAALNAHQPDRLHNITTTALLALLDVADPVPADLVARAQTAIEKHRRDALALVADACDVGGDGAA